jgi:hypothetical protein
MGMNIYESIDDFNRIMGKPRKSRLDTCVMSIIKSCDVADFNPYHIRKQTQHYCDIFVFNEMNADIIFDGVKDCLWTCYNESKEPTLEMFHSFFDVLYDFRCGVRTWGMTHKINTIDDINFEDVELDDTYFKYANVSYEWDYNYNDANEKEWFLIKYEDNDEVFYKEKLRTDDLLNIMKNDILNDLKTKTYEEESIELGHDNYDYFDVTEEELFDSYKNIYFYLAKLLGSLKQTSIMFKNMGIDGFKGKSFGYSYDDGQDGDFNTGDYIVCVINMEKLKYVKPSIVTSKDFKRY